MKKRVKLFVAILLFCVGVFIFIYPRVTDILYKKDVNYKLLEFDNIVNNNKISNYDSKVSNNSDNTNNTGNNNYKTLYELLDSRNKLLYQSRQVDFTSRKSYEYDDIDLSSYGLENNIIGFIIIPSINITLPIYLGANDNNMRLGAVHLTGTSYPIGGINTNSVIAAHRGFYKTSMFRHIDDIKIGDKLYIKNFIGVLTYKAVDIDVISSDGIGKLTINDNRDMVTIISCHPYPFNYQRYVVYFEREI